ncbi:MAG TPA: enoyl-CoA hydratase/isomerase family protein [Burkholderiales bacterium]|nr:enoyl-CoA hydratase/isomerase family protein [Burkholderiales bacterium]
MHSPLDIEKREAVAIVTLNRPESLNAINRELRTRLTGAMQTLGSDDGVRAVVITGAGERAFCSGQDLTETAGYDVEDVEAWLTENHAMYRALRNLDVPAIAAFNGVAAGAGFQIGLCCDLRVGYPEMKIGQPEIKAGLASIVGSQLMTAYVGVGHNLELSLTGELISGSRAYEIGLLNRLVSREKVLETALALSQSLARLPPTAMRLTKQRLRALTDPGFEAALAAAIAAQKAAYASGEPRQAMRRFLEKRKRD